MIKSVDAFALVEVKIWADKKNNLELMVNLKDVVERRSPSRETLYSYTTSSYFSE